MSIRTKRDLQGLRSAARVVRECLEEMKSHVRPGVSTRRLNEIGAEVFRRRGARSAPMLVYRFPAEICISVNDELVHGIPSDRVLRQGDLVKLDVTAEKGGYMADAAETVGVGRISDRDRALVECTRRAFGRAMEVARAGVPLNEIGRAVEQEASRSGFTVVRDLSGHGIGRTIHEPPRVLNYFDPRARRILTKGLVLAVEPILSAGASDCESMADGWTVRTVDGSRAAHHEHTIVITDDAPVVLTAA